MFRLYPAKSIRIQFYERLGVCAQDLESLMTACVCLCTCMYVCVCVCICVRVTRGTLLMLVEIRNAYTGDDFY